LESNIEIQLVAEEGMFKDLPLRCIKKKWCCIRKKSGKLDIEPLSMDIDVQL
jgi:hypothetical protein